MFAGGGGAAGGAAAGGEPFNDLFNMFINSDGSGQRDELYREYGFRWHDENGNRNDILRHEHAMGRISLDAYDDQSRALQLDCARSFIMTPEIQQAWRAFQADPMRGRVDPMVPAGKSVP